MTSLDTASALYEDVVDGNEQGAGSLASELERKAREVREAASEEATSSVQEETREELLQALETVEPERAQDTVEEVADHLEEAAVDIRSSIDSTVTMKELPSGVAGQAELDSSNVWIDTHSIRSQDGSKLIDTSVAKDIADHEEEHTRQSKTSNQEGVTINGKEFDGRQVREAAAISVQQNIDFLSAEYKQITSDLPMDSADRVLVQKGDFAGLERKKNGAEVPLAA